MRSGGGEGRGGSFRGRCGFLWIALLIANDFMLMATMVILVVRVKMIVVVSLMVAMVTSMGSPLPPLWLIFLFLPNTAPAIRCIALGGW